MRLCARFMTQRKENGWKRPGSAFRQVQIGSDEKFGLAFKDDLLDSQLLPLNDAHDFRVEGRALRQLADVGEQLPPELSSPCFDCAGIFQARPLGEVLRSFALQPAAKPLLHVAQLPNRFCEVELVSR